MDKIDDFIRCRGSIVIHLIQYPDFRQGIPTLKYMLIYQTYNIRIKTIKGPDIFYMSDHQDKNTD